MSILLLILAISAIVAIILAGMNKCPLWVGCLLLAILVVLIVVPGHTVRIHG